MKEGINRRAKMILLNFGEQRKSAQWSASVEIIRMRPIRGCEDEAFGKLRKGRVFESAKP